VIVGLAFRKADHTGERVMGATGGTGDAKDWLCPVEIDGMVCRRVNHVVVIRRVECHVLDADGVGHGMVGVRLKSIGNPVFLEVNTKKNAAISRENHKTNYCNADWSLSQGSRAHRWNGTKHLIMRWCF
jgi:hypothetical protein